tara:strand:- start:968 stop:1282 length:315 start_codon:yes stop_codon:yes gene_type:complete
MALSKYSKDDLKKIVEIYNLSIDEKTLKKKKGDLIKEMNKKGKGQLNDNDEIDKKLKKHKGKKDTHKMPDGTIMSGKKHNKKSKAIDPKQPKITSKYKPVKKKD